MENVYFEDDAGVSPQLLAVRVRVQGGLILAYRDSFLCSRLPLQASFAPVPEKQDMAICFESVIAREHSDRGDLLLISSSRGSVATVAICFFRRGKCVF